MLLSINRLHDRVNSLVSMLLFEAEVSQRYWNKDLNSRQYAIVNQLLDRPRPFSLAELRRAPWYLALYAKLTDKTRQRDLWRLRDLNLIEIDKEQKIWPWFALGAAATKKGSVP